MVMARLVCAYPAWDNIAEAPVAVPSGSIVLLLCSSLLLLCSQCSTKAHEQLVSNIRASVVTECRLCTTLAPQATQHSTGQVIAEEASCA